jgi:hypothetical protein
MPGVLRIYLDEDSDGLGLLSVIFEAAGFSGIGSAWFDLKELEKHVERFAAFPISAENFPCIKGGYWNANATKLEQEHVCLSVEPRGGLGNLVISVKVANLGDGQVEQRFCASGDLRCDYSQLSNFVQDFIKLIHGELKEVVLNESI